MTRNYYKKLLVIGNSKSVLEYELGQQIDKFDGLVCRFNNFQIEGFEKYVGRRTDVLLRRACDDIRLYNSENLSSVIVFVTYCLWSVGMQTVARQVKSFYGEKCIIVPLGKCKEIGEKIGLNQPNKEWASVGALALGYLTETVGEANILIHGFDHKESHYFKKPPKDGYYHNWDKERSYINSLNLRNYNEVYI